MQRPFSNQIDRALQYLFQRIGNRKIILSVLYRVQRLVEGDQYINVAYFAESFCTN
nr:hypothetical protein [Spirosoma rhododendri]